MPPTLLILPTASDRADDVRFVLAPESIPHPDEHINGVLSRLALERPRFTWREAEERLTAEGFIVPRVAVAARAWNGAHEPLRAGFAVRFPETAGHEFAGRGGTASSEATGFFHITLDDMLVVSSWDQPYRQGQEGFEQVPLGPVIVGREQFATDADHQAAIAALLEAGFECEAEV